MERARAAWTLFNLEGRLISSQSHPKCGRAHGPGCRMLRQARLTVRQRPSVVPARLSLHRVLPLSDPMGLLYAPGVGAYHPICFGAGPAYYIFCFYICMQVITAFVAFTALHSEAWGSLFFFTNFNCFFSLHAFFFFFFRSLSHMHIQYHGE